MEKKNYTSISIKLLDIIPSIEKLITREEEEYLIIFQGNNTFFDLKKILISKEEIIININKNKKTIIISLVKADILISTSIFNIKDGLHWIIFNCENNSKLSLSNKIKIKMHCKINKEYYLIKNNSLNNLLLKDIYIDENNKNKEYSPIKSEIIDNKNNYSNKIKSSFSYNPHKMNKNYYYYSILSENVSNENFKSNPSLSNEQKLLSKLNNNKMSKSISFNKNIIKKKLNSSNKNVNKKIYINLNKNHIENIINDEYILKTIEGIKPNKKIKRIINKDNKNKNENNNNYDSNRNIKDNNNIFRNYFYSCKQKKGTNINIHVNNNNKILKSPYTSKTFKSEANNNIKNNKDKNNYMNQELNDLFPNNNDEKINLNNNEKKLLDNKKENNNFNNCLDYSYDKLNDDSYELDNFYKLKEDFLLLYSEEYNKNVKEDLLKLEIDLFVEKMIDLINAFHSNINEKFLENKIIENKFKTNISKYISIRKLYSKLQQLENVQKGKKNDYLNINNNLKYDNFLNKNEIDLFKLLFPTFKNFTTDLNINKNKQLKEIINIILIKKENIKLLDEKSIKWLEKNNIYKDIEKNEDIKNKKKINNNKKNQIYENNYSIDYINNNSVNNSKSIYKKKKAVSYSLNNNINSFKN